MYDSRLGRQLSLDPLMSDYPWQSPYVYHRNSPIAIVDYLGMGDPPVDDGTAKRDDKMKTEDGEEYIYTCDDICSDNDGWKSTKEQVKSEYQDALDNSTAPFKEDNGKYTVRGNNVGPFLPVPGNLLDEWRTGTGPVNSVIQDNHYMIGMLKTWSEIDAGRDYFYNKYKNGIPAGASLTNFQLSFGLIGVIEADANWVRQFVGTASLDIFLSEDKKSLIFVLTDSKSKKSFYYRAAENHERTEKKEEGNTYQKYIWTEPLKKPNPPAQKGKATSVGEAMKSWQNAYRNMAPSF